MTKNALKIGQTLRGKWGNYQVSENLCRNVWTAINAEKKLVVVKTAAPHRLENERKILSCFNGRPGFRQLIDEISHPSEPPLIVLRHLDDNLLDACRYRSLRRPDIKFVASMVLTALQDLHEKGYVHTDVKPNNVFINYQCNGRATRVHDVELGDYGDVYCVDPSDDSKEGHRIGAAIFRSPEAMLNLRWDTPTDIWSFGATLMSMIWGNFHMFKPSADLGLDPEDEEYPVQVVFRQLRFFGPFPLKFQDIADEERLGIATAAMNYINEKKLRKPFELAKDPELKEGDKEFILKIMKVDPRDRPTARELLDDVWFKTS